MLSQFLSSSFVLCTDSIGKFKRCSQFVTVCLLLCLAFWRITSPSSFCCKTFSMWRLCRFHSCLSHIQPGHRSTHSPMTGWMEGSRANNVPPGHCCCPRCLIWFYFFRALASFDFLWLYQGHGSAGAGERQKMGSGQTLQSHSSFRNAKEEPVWQMQNLSKTLMETFRLLLTSNICHLFVTFVRSHLRLDLPCASKAAGYWQLGDQQYQWYCGKGANSFPIGSELLGRLDLLWGSGCANVKGIRKPATTAPTSLFTASRWNSRKLPMLS